MTDQTAGKKILVVDDNRDSRELVLKVLKRKGYELFEAVDGEDALARVEEHLPDLILMDISLPKIDGYEATGRLKKDSRFQHIPVIALTAHAMKGDREKALGAGCRGYIAKPINVRELPEIIEGFLNQTATDPEDMG